MTDSTPRIPGAAFSVDLELAIPNLPGYLGRITTAIGSAGGNIASLDIAEHTGDTLIRRIAVFAADTDHVTEIVQAVEAIEGVTVRQIRDRVMELHRGGKIEVVPRIPLRHRDDLSMAYTPGVARVCEAIAKDPMAAHEFTIKKNTVAVVSDGTAILGLGNLGPEAAMPVMEGKALLFKHFANIDAFPLCVDVRTTDELVRVVEQIAPAFGGINLEDIAAPACFEVEERLRASLDIPVFHDDQHGTAVVTLAALRNACRVLDRRFEDLRVVIAGTGAAGMAVAKILIAAGIGDVIGVDRTGIIHSGRPDLTDAKRWLAENANRSNLTGTLSDSLVGSDVFVGVSGPNLIGRDEVASMAKNPVVFAMANPTPEVMPEAVRDIVGVMATGRSDYPNQINNVLAFPGIFRGALDVGATEITENMKIAAADAIASSVSDDELCADCVVPSVFDTSVVARVAELVGAAAIADGVIRSR